MTTPTPRKVFRFFPTADHANALASGNVWLSTLQTCRGYEDPLRGDKGEASQEFRSSYLQGDGDNPDLQTITQRLGIKVGPTVKNLTIGSGTRVMTLPDAYVLCTTEHFSPENLGDTFGRFCVEIREPDLFCQYVANALNRVTPLTGAQHASVTYRDRIYRDLEASPGTLGFVKPADGYAIQKEYRFLWTPKGAPLLKPFLLPVHETSGLCQRIA